jgi:hypothetical protein
MTYVVAGTDGQLSVVGQKSLTLSHAELAHFFLVLIEGNNFHKAPISSFTEIDDLPLLLIGLAHHSIAFGAQIPLCEGVKQAISIILRGDKFP